MAEKEMPRETAVIEQCMCGSEFCNYYGLNIGHFHVGTGFDKKMAEEIAMMWNGWDLVQQRLDYAVDEHAKVLVKNADLRDALLKIGGGHLKDMSTLVLAGRWHKIVEKFQEIAKDALK